MVYINTLTIQWALGEVEWQQRFTAEDWRGLSPLLFTHINPHGTFWLDMNTQAKEGRIAAGMAGRRQSASSMKLC
jgi:hypothetical protein